MLDFTGLSWDMFAASGQIGYYMLYKNLKQDEENAERDIADKTR